MDKKYWRRFQFYGELIFLVRMKDTLKVEIYMYSLCPITLANREIYFSIIGEFKGTLLEGFIEKIHMSRNIPSVKKEMPVKMSCLILTGLFYSLYTSYNPQMPLLLSYFNRRKLKTATKKKSKTRKFLESYPWKWTFTPVKK